MKCNFLLLSMSVVFSLVADSTTTVYKYRIYCITEAQNVYQWGQTEPTKCPNNTAHTINPNSISIVDEQGPALTSIKEETTPTGGHYRAQTETITANAGPGVTSSMEFSWPFDITVLAIYFIGDTNTAGDVINVTVAADTVYGIITQNVAAGATVIPVNSTVITNIAKGYHVKLNDGTNSDDLGRVIAIDTVNSAITTEVATVHSFANVTPTNVTVSIRPIDTFQLVAGLPYTLGIKKIGGTFLPANTPVTVTYLNNTNAQKSLVLGYEYLY